MAGPISPSETKSEGSQAMVIAEVAEVLGLRWRRPACCSAPSKTDTDRLPRRALLRWRARLGGAWLVASGSFFSLSLPLARSGGAGAVGSAGLSWLWTR